MEKEKWFVQVYDEEGNACKMPRVFDGTAEEVNTYIEERFETVDLIFGRNTIAYKESDGYNEENIPQKIDVEDYYKKLKIIDFARKGNVIRFYLGDIDCNDYYGDDWNDRPYEHNAGTVYNEFIKDVYDISVPYYYSVFEPCDGVLNSSYCKDDMREEKVPCVIIYKPEKDEYVSDFNYCLGNKNCIKIYFNTTLDELLDIMCEL